MRGRFLGPVGPPTGRPGTRLELVSRGGGRSPYWPPAAARVFFLAPAHLSQRRSCQDSRRPVARSACTAAVVAALASAAPGAAQDADPPSTGEWSSFREAFANGRTWINLRYRFEHVDAEGFTRDADASTLRTVLGYESGAYHDFKFLLEVEDVAPIGNENYNSTVNGNTTRPVVADPDGTEVNQAYVDYLGLEDAHVRVGRQQVTLDNHRFVGNVGWRQNHQTFDAAAFISSHLPNTTVLYAFVHNVNRIFGQNHPAGDLETRAHLLNVAHDLEGVGKLTAYLYHLDIEQVASLSTSTVGVRATGKQDMDGWSLHYTGEVAHQSDAADNTLDVDEEYWLAELGGSAKGATLRFGYEHLGGSGNPGEGSFSTPLATLHKFNGFADQFLSTPATGLEDYYVTLSGDLFDAKCAATYHVFESDSMGLDYGDELDLTVGYPVNDEVTIGLKYADFNGDEGGFTDTWKAMGWLSVALL